MRRLFSLGIVAGILLALTLAAPARADTYDRLAFLTFSGPVQVPGAILDAGTYRFRLANPDTSRNILQVLSNDGYSVYATFHTTPDWRMETTNHPTVTFRETPAGLPAAVKSVFWADEHNGFAFVYPKGEPMMKPIPVRQTPVTYTPMTPVAKPFFAEPDHTLAFAEPGVEAGVPVTELTAAEPEAAVPEELPKTATFVPLMAVGGLTSLLAGLGISLLRRRVN
jgi:LPXTG-motif cell wall-anchored protein